ncbi:DUF3116 family protein [Listeria sp. PSOL-1]|uniref:DUF3116 family protein n=1 Tax=Listeria sp. PSOL-1 TaxID=1844999 RepID=UPI0013D0499B|nr:DUF3116 family protein [Listeria sp. PSOL-1]
MQEPSDKMKYAVLKYVMDPNFYFINFQDEIFDADHLSGKEALTRNEILYTVYWLESESYVIRKRVNAPANKTYFISEKGRSLYEKLKKMS